MLYRVKTNTHTLEIAFSLSFIEAWRRNLSVVHVISDHIINFWSLFVTSYVFWSHFTDYSRTYFLRHLKNFLRHLKSISLAYTLLISGKYSLKIESYAGECSLLPSPSPKHKHILPPSSYGSFTSSCINVLFNIQHFFLLPGFDRLAFITINYHLSLWRTELTCSSLLIRNALSEYLWIRFSFNVWSDLFIIQKLRFYKCFVICIHHFLLFIGHTLSESQYWFCLTLTTV